MLHSIKAVFKPLPEIITASEDIVLVELILCSIVDLTIELCDAEIMRDALSYLLT